MLQILATALLMLTIQCRLIATFQKTDISNVSPARLLWFSSFSRFSLVPYFPPHKTLQVIIIIIIIIIIINCNWVVTRWQWLFYMYTKCEIGY